MAVLSNDHLSTTLNILLRKHRDSTFKKVPFLDEVLKRAVIDAGGNKLTFGFGVNEHSTLTQYSSGTEVGSLAVSTIDVPASADWCIYDGPIVMTIKDELLNNGPLAVRKIMEGRVKQVLNTIRSETEKQLLVGTSTVLTDLQTMNGISYTTGWFEELVFGSQSNTVCGVAKSSYTATLQNQFGNAGSSFATNGIDTMSEVRDAADEVSGGSDGLIDMIIASMASFRLYSSSLRAQERYAPKDALDGGRNALLFGNARMYNSSRFSAATVFNGGVGLSMYMLNSSAIEAHILAGANFKKTNFVDVRPGRNKAATIDVGLQVVPLALNCHGIVCNADT